MDGVMLGRLLVGMSENARIGYMSTDIDLGKIRCHNKTRICSRYVSSEAVGSVQGVNSVNTSGGGIVRCSVWLLSGTGIGVAILSCTSDVEHRFILKPNLVCAPSLRIRCASSGLSESK